MKDIFNYVPGRNLPYNKFDLRHDIKCSGKMGQLIPTVVAEVLPGDVFEISLENMVRFAPLLSPIMHEVCVTHHLFFVPYRLLWPGWEDHRTLETDILAPYESIGTVNEGSIADYMGLSSFGTTQPISAFFFAAYYLIYDEYYRDQNLITEKFQELVAGLNTFTTNSGLATPLRRAWNHDYFTSALPFAQPSVQ